MNDTIYLIWAIFSFAVGTLFGSFFTLAIYRIPRKQDITHTRSYCPNCKHRLGFFDCFPILSFVSTIGRCKYCQKKISLRYPLIELLSGFVFLFIYIFCGFSWQALVLVPCFVYLVLVVGSDIMESKMTDEEKAEVKKMVEEKKNKKKEKETEKKNNEKVNKKAGGLNVDIAVAVVIFMFFFLIAIYTISNYSNNLSVSKRKIDATGVCLNVMNTEKAKDYDALTGSTGTETLDNTTYTYTVTVSSVSKNSGVTLNNAKSINVTVSYMVNGEPYEVTLDALKMEDAIWIKKEV